jgi:metal-responsive CopG/Arc/MetJ family transcriptional regulator
MTMKVVSFKIDPEMLELLDRYASRHNMDRSEVIRRAIDRMIKDNNTYNIKVEKFKMYK